MNEFKKGDKIVITTVGKKPLSGRYFWKGDIGVIRDISQDPEETEYYIDFDNQGNKKVYGDGQWFISSDVKKDDDRYAQFKLYEEPEVIDWTKYEGKEAWFSISGGTKEWFKGRLYKYDPELTPAFLAILDKDQDTIRQFNCIKTSGEIDWWEYVGKEIIVSDSVEGAAKKVILHSYDPALNAPFICEAKTWRYARLIEDKDVDWSKIPIGTKVIVSDTPDFSEPRTEEFLCYTPDRGYPFWVVAGGGLSETANAYKYCKLA